MKKLLLPVATLLLCANAFAAAPFVDMTALRAYAKKAMQKCPDAVLTVNSVPSQGPLNFLLYEVQMKSTGTDTSCDARKYLLYSPATQQVLLGTVFALPDDGRPIAQRLSARTSEMLKENIVATVSPFPLPDGLKAATLTKQTPYGPFSYHAYVDASERFFLVAQRGNLRTDPTKTLRDALGADKAVRRGSKTAKVEILELSDYECPTCARAHAKIEPLIAKNLSKVNYGRLDLPLFEHHEWSLFAALGAHAIQKVAPAKYWEYTNYVFSNQEQIGKQPFEQVLKNFCEDHDVPWAKIAPIYNSTTERQAILDAVSRAFDNGINSTPTFIINGQVMGFGPDGKIVIDAIKEAVK
jgi:protein-disulfide isomerase